jgi:beta-glucanase (GH16 family)
LRGVGAQDFHVFSMDMFGTYIIWYVDGQRIQYISCSQFADLYPGSTCGPFDNPFYFIFNVAVGGNVFPEQPTGYPGWSATLVVDYIRVYGTYYE